MPEDKPFGWRPLTPEYRANLEGMGFSPEAIAETEANNRYQPLEIAVEAWELARATMLAVDDLLSGKLKPLVRAELDRRAAEAAASGEVEGEVEGPIIQALADQDDFWGPRA